jgi:uncharacterized membrane protein YdfJ with MMPL/SSD domain
MEFITRYKWWILGAVLVIAVIYFMTPDSEETTI